MVGFTNLVEPCYPAIWPCNIVLGDVQQLKGCLYKTFKRSDGVQSVSRRMSLLAEGDKILFLP